MKNKLVGAVLMLLGVAFAGHAGAQIIVPAEDSDFSSPALSANTFIVAPSGTGWTFSSFFEDAETAPNESGVANGLAQNLNTTPGNQAAFLQNVSSISQDVTLPTSTVSLTLDLEGRAPQTYIDSQDETVTTGQDEIEVMLGDILLYEGTPTNTGSFVTITTSSAGFSAGTYVLSINGVTSGDATSDSPATFKDTMTFVDNVVLNVTVTPEPSSTAMLVLGGLVLGGITLRRRFVRPSSS